MQENAAKIRVKTGNSGTFTGKIEKKQKIFQIFFKYAPAGMFEKFLSLTS